MKIVQNQKKIHTFNESWTYGDACMPNWYQRHRTLGLRSPHWACIGTRRNDLRQETFLPHFSTASLLLRLCNYILPFESMAVVLLATRCWCSPAWIVFFHSGLLMAKMGKARSGIRCWVSVAIDCFCHCHTNVILWCTVKVTKAATWFHPLALLRLTGTKLSGVWGYSPISYKVVITSFGTVEMLDTQTG